MSDIETMSERLRKKRKLEKSPKSPELWEGFTKRPSLRSYEKIKFLMDECAMEEAARIPLPEDDVPHPEEVATSTVSSTPANSTDTQTATNVSTTGAEEGSARDNSRLSDVPDQKCGFCIASLVGTRVHCFTCNQAFHPSQGCLGISVEAINVLIDGNNGATPYRCCECRSKPTSNGGDHQGGDSEGYLQLVKLMQSMKRELDELKSKSVGDRVRQARVDGAVNNNNQTVGNEAWHTSQYSRVRNGAGHANRNDPQTPHDSGTIGRDEVLSHLKELREREKRVESIILRGFEVDTVEGIKQKFSEVCNALQIPPVTLVGLDRVGVTNIYRARITDKEKRKEILTKSVDLRHSRNFKHVYINKDLTYIQRQEVISRRKAAQRLAGGNTANSMGRDNTSQATEDVAMRNGQRNVRGGREASGQEGRETVRGEGDNRRGSGLGNGRRGRGAGDTGRYDGGEGDNRRGNGRGGRGALNRGRYAGGEGDNRRESGRGSDRGGQGTGDRGPRGYEYAAAVNRGRTGRGGSTTPRPWGNNNRGRGGRRGGRTNGTLNSPEPWSHRIGNIPHQRRNQGGN